MPSFHVEIIEKIVKNTFSVIGPAQFLIGEFVLIASLICDLSFLALSFQTSPLSVCKALAVCIRVFLCNLMDTNPVIAFDPTTSGQVVFIRK